MPSTQAHQIAIQAAIAVLTAAAIAVEFLPTGASAQNQITHSLRPSVKNHSPFLIFRVQGADEPGDDEPPIDTRGEYYAYCFNWCDKAGRSVAPGLMLSCIHDCMSNFQNYQDTPHPQPQSSEPEPEPPPP
jgi:hypothetical protein